VVDVRVFLIPRDNAWLEVPAPCVVLDFFLGAMEVSMEVLDGTLAMEILEIWRSWAKEE